MDDFDDLGPGQNDLPIIHSPDHVNNSGERPPLLEENSFEVEMHSFVKEEKLEADAVKWAVQKHSEKDKMVTIVYNTYKRNSDKEDFLNSLKRLH